MSKNIYQYHYVYRITNIIENKHYYGSRSTNLKPKDDLGKRYFSSSKDKDFIKDQKNNPSGYKYKIIYIFCARRDAILMEIKLHNKFNVGVNDSFYNRSKQTSIGFDTTGILHPLPFREKISRATKGENNPRYGIVVSEETKRKISIANKGKKHIPHTEEYKLKMSKLKKGFPRTEADKQKMRGIPKSESHKKKISEMHKGNTYFLGRKHSPDTIEKMKKPKSEEHKKKLKEARAKQQLIYVCRLNDQKVMDLGNFTKWLKNKRN